VEASEAARRIFWRHRWLLLILMILPAAAVVPLREHLPVQYKATATVQGQGTTPDATTQVDAIHSRVSAVAADPVLVQSAISQAKVSRNAVQVARNAISVTPLGSSAIMMITVTDPSSTVAVVLARSLASAVVNQLNQLGIKDNPELVLLSKTNAQLISRRDQLLSELHAAGGSNAATSVPVQSLLSQLGAAEQQLASNNSEAQQVLAALTTETGASVVSLPTAATGVSRHVVADSALAALAGLVLGLLIVTVREVMRPTVAQPTAGARELGAVLFGGCDARGDRILSIDRDLPERLNLAAHRAGVLSIVLTGPGSRARLAALAARLRDELPLPGPSADPRRPAIVDGGHRPVGLAAEPPTDIAAVRMPKPQRTVVTLNDIRLGAPPLDAALVVALPRFAPHSALDQAADLGVTADWPILGVIGIRRRSWLAALFARHPAAPEPPAAETQEPAPVPYLKAPDGMHMEGEDD
jgi:capsular polysaccharide biosynthesis protein